MTRMLRISPVGVRGVVGTGLTAQHVLDFSTAFGTFLETGAPVLVARDPRASSTMVREGVVAGLMACGHEVIDLGVAGTPVIQHTIRRTGAAGGVSIGASHNSADWNALKFLGRDGVYLSTLEANELLDIYHLRKFNLVEWGAIGKLWAETGAIDAYIDTLAATFDLPALRGFRVVVDCCNGTSALILRRLNERFGFSFILINEKLGSVAFAHEPATTRDMVNLQLAPLMRPLNADAGFLFDIDSDRVAIASEEGEAISEEMILPLLADYFLPRHSGKLVITNLSTTALLEEVASKHGGTVLRVPVGRQAAIDAIAAHRPEQVALAGEGTGAVMLPQFRFVYDGIASMLALLSMLLERGQTLSRIVESYPRFRILKGQVPLVTKRIPALLNALREQYADGRANTLDGLRVDWPDHWLHVRVSQTEPIIRVICEARGAAPVALFNGLMETVRSFA